MLTRPVVTQNSGKLNCQERLSQVQPSPAKTLRVPLVMALITVSDNTVLELRAHSDCDGGEGGVMQVEALVLL